MIEMTTDDVKRIIIKWRQSRHSWPTRRELETALHAEGFTVDSAELEELLDMLRTANALQVVGGKFVI